MLILYKSTLHKILNFNSCPIHKIVGVFNFDFGVKTFSTDLKTF